MTTDPVSVVSSLGRVHLPTIHPPVKGNVGKPSDELKAKISLFDPNLPYEQARAIPPIWYRDPQIYEAERSTVFGQNWVAVGRVGDVLTPRSYFKEQVAEEPVAVLRGADGNLRAFLNVCRHRATELLTNSRGILTDDKVKCDYHGWCYDLTGRLCKAPELGPVEGFSREGYSLIPFEAGTFDPLVFIRMQPGTENLSTTFEPIVQRTKDMELSSMKWAGRKEYEVGCNWKVYVDNFLDGGYHVPTIHPALIKALNYSQYRTEIFDRCSLQHSPTKTANDDPTVALRQGAEAMYWWIYPNVMVNLYKGVMDTNIVLPLGPDRCKVIFDFYFSDGWDQPSIDKYITDAHQVQLEDMGVCERVQRGLTSNFIEPGPYGKRETGEYHFHQLLARQLQTAVDQ